jgi:large subunit ribosomal protein L31
MKEGIHPQYLDCQVTCSCGESFSTRAVMPEIKVAICYACHPFYTGSQKIIDTEGRVDRFNKRYAKSNAATSAKAASSTVAKH